MTQTIEPSHNPVYMMPLLLTAMSSGYLRLVSLVITTAFLKRAGLIFSSNVVSGRGKVKEGA